jgi:hypothetical protein
MPFQSKAQRRACYAKKDPNWDCGEWESHTHGDLPERKKQEKKSFKEFLQERDPKLYDHFLNMSPS